MILSDEDNDYETDDIDESSMMMLPRVQWIQQLCAIWGEGAGCCSCAHSRFLKKKLEIQGIVISNYKSDGLNHARVLCCEAHTIVTLT